MLFSPILGELSGWSRDSRGGGELERRPTDTLADLVEWAAGRCLKK